MHFTYHIIVQELTPIGQQQVVPKRKNRGADQTRTRRTTSADQGPAGGAKHCQKQGTRIQRRAQESDDARCRNANK